MKTVLALALMVALCGCQSLQPTAVNPAVTDASNNVKSLIAAQAGDCSVPLAATTTADCANLDRTTTTVDANVTSIGACVADAGAVKLGGQVAALKAALCTRATTAAAPVVVAVPATK